LQKLLYASTRNWEFWECKCFFEGGIAMRKGVLIKGAGISRNAAEPGRALAVSRDEMRAFLTFCLAASLLAVYTFAWATSLSS
jgi:hypothetical protein